MNPCYPFISKQILIVSKKKLKNSHQVWHKYLCCDQMKPECNVIKFLCISKKLHYFNNVITHLYSNIILIYISIISVFCGLGEVLAFFQSLWFCSRSKYYRSITHWVCEVAWLGCFQDCTASSWCITMLGLPKLCFLYFFFRLKICKWGVSWLVDHLTHTVNEIVFN